MKALFVKGYLYFVAFVLSLTFVGKVPAVLQTIFGLLHTNSFLAMYGCLENPIFGPNDPTGLSNNQWLAIASGIEFSIVMLICFCRARWVPCLASALWGTICVAARVYFTVSDTDCGCLGWLASPGPTANLIVGFLALAISAGGYIALAVIWRDSKRFQLANRVALQ